MQEQVVTATARKLWPVTQETERELVGHLRIPVDGQQLTVVDWRYEHSAAIKRLDSARAEALMRAYKIALQDAGYYLDTSRKNRVVVVDEKYNILSTMSLEEAGQKTGQANTKKGRDTAPEVDEVALKAALKELDKLIGLDDIKARVHELVNFIRVQGMREKAGLPGVDNAYHMVFTGNPGTGKTTVARIIGDIFHALGLLSKGGLVETDRSGLVGQYIGATAIKTNALIDEAVGGILFIDEAYALAGGGDKDFGAEALATLLKRMEDQRDDLIVILAGYTEEMKALLNSNPGLRSRFKTVLHFNDYSDADLEGIFTLFMRKYSLRYGVKVKDLVRATLDYERETAEHFGNGRSARNLFEEAIINQANRLALIKNPTPRQLSTLMAVDIPNPKE
jgi:SpoVK/Ycf46/Vps4 family AAA+-type ATPase